MTAFIRFFFVSLVGVAIDLAVSYVMASNFGMPLWIAGAFGFTLAALVNYLLHAVWTFSQTTPAALSRSRSMMFVISCAVTLGARLAMLSGLSLWFSHDHMMLAFILSLIFSFCVNFLVSKYLIFTSSHEKRATRNDD